MVFPSSPGKLFKIIPIGDLGAIKNFKDMATEKNSKGSVKNFFSACWKVVENIGKGILITIILIGMILFWFNPIFFLPISLLAPKAAADSLYDLDIEIFSDFWQMFYTPWVALLPMRWKKYFMAVRGIRDYSAGTQLKYYRAVAGAMPKKQREIISQMSDDAQKLLWKRGSDDDRIQLGTVGYKPSIAQLRRLDTGVLDHLLTGYAKKNTLSEDILDLLLERGLTHLFVMHAEKNGLSARMVSKVFSLNGLSSGDPKRIEREKLMTAIKEALQRYAEKQTVLRTQHGTSQNVREWEAFLAEMQTLGRELCLVAQCSMNVWQYEAFHKAGFLLSQKAVAALLSFGEETMCKQIFAYEPAESFTDKAKALIDANPKLKSWQLLSVAEV